MPSGSPLKDATNVAFGARPQGLLLRRDGVAIEAYETVRWPYGKISGGMARS
jgi:hypothetical protein